VPLSFPAPITILLAEP